MLAKTENQNGTIVGCSEWGLASSIYVCHRAAVFTAALLALLYVALWTTLGIAVATVAVPPAIGLPHWHLVRAGSPIAEPYPALHGGSFSGPKVKLSPDPLVSYRWRHPRAGSGLQTYVLRPVAIRTQTPQSFSGLKSVTGSHCYITVKGTGSFCVDFGTESAAWIEFDSPDLNGGKVEMGVSEYNAPAHDGRQLPKGGYAPAIAVPEKIGNTYRLKLNPQYYDGVRFGWIYVRSFSGQPWHITAVRAVCQIKPTNYNGSYSCSNPMLTRIWYTGAYTVKLNLLKKYFGAILMDRGDRISWVGDAHIAQSTAMTAFGNFNFVKRNLNISAGKGNGIASYYLYWVLSLVDYYRYTGDTAELRRYYPLVKTLLGKAAADFAHPHIVFYGWGDRLGGFTSAENPQAREAYRMLFVETCRRFAWAAGAAGNRALQTQYASIADQYAAKIQSRPDWDHNVNIYPASDAINAGVPTAAQERELYYRCFANRLDRLSYSPFNEYFVVEAMARAHLWDQAIETVLDDWGGQIKYGGTTFFEVYRPSWNKIIPTNGGIPSSICGPTSLCHPWSSGSTTWLTQWIAGIRPVTPGFSTVDIIPHLGRTLTWVKATAPTPHGTISESVNVNSGTGTFIIPAGVVAKIGVPKVGRRITAITVNGYRAWRDGHFTACPGLGGAVPSRNFVYFTNVRPGHYTLTISYQGQTPPFLPAPFIYPVQVLGQDPITHGNWGGVYGHDGYVLVADGPKEANIEHLPGYVQYVHCLWGHKTQWPTNGSDPRALAASPLNGRRDRVAGVFFSDMTSQPPQAAVDIRLKRRRNYRLALYAVDFDHRNRKEIITIEDLRTKKLLAPVQAFSHFSGGQYMVFECHGSVRIRFDPIRGGNAVLSGIFFDPPGG